MTGRMVRFLGVSLAVLVVISVTAYGQRLAAWIVSASPLSVKKTYTLTVAGPTQFESVTATLRDLTIIARVGSWSGIVLDRPELRGTMTVANRSPDHFVEVLGWRLAFLDRQGQPLPSGTDGQGVGASLSTIDALRIAPGHSSGVAIEAPFPQAALHADRVTAVSVELKYFLVPIREQTAAVATRLKSG